jgi:hypothetical protein
MQKQRTKIANILDSQIRVAKRLTRDKRDFSFESRIAWEIVEELSKKLHRVDHNIEEAIKEDRDYYAKMNMDMLLSEREYDI